MMEDSTEEPAKEILNTFIAAQSATDNSTSSSVSSAAETAAKSLLDAYDKQVQEIGSVVLEYAQDQSSDSDIRQLVQITQALQKQCSTEEYHEFGWAVREAWNYFDPEDDDSDQATEREKWRRLNTFVASLAANEDDSVLLNGLWTLRSALEDKQGIEGNLPAAAMWMVYAGKAIYGSTETFKPANSKGGDPAKPGAKFEGQSGFSRSRWTFWKQGFETAHADASLSDGTRQWAGKAVGAMSEVESDA